MTPIRVFLYDPEPLRRGGLSALLAREPDIEVVGEADSAPAVQTLAARAEPDVIIATRSQPAADTVRLVRKLTSTGGRDVHVVLLVDSLGEQALCAASVAGCAVMSKTISPTELTAAVRLVGAGYVPIDKHLATRFSSVLNQLVTRSNENERLCRLTRREREVFELIAQGLSNVEIADALVVAQSTVKTHVRCILKKLRLRDRVQAVAFAHQAGLAAAA